MDQEQDKNDLQRLRMSDLVAESMSKKTALDETFKVVERTSKNVLKGFNCNQHKANVLRLAFLDPQWAKQPLSALGVGTVGFQDLDRRLQGALALDNNSNAAARCDRASAHGGGAVAAGVFYTGHGRNGVPKIHVGNQALVQQGVDCKMLSVSCTGGCWSCGDTTHCLADCNSVQNDWEQVRKGRRKFEAERRTAKDVAATVDHEICC